MLASYLLSRTLVPLLSRMLLVSEHHGHQGKISCVSEAQFSRLETLHQSPGNVSQSIFRALDLSRHPGDHLDDPFCRRNRFFPFSGYRIDEIALSRRFWNSNRANRRTGCRGGEDYPEDCPGRGTPYNQLHDWTSYIFSIWALSPAIMLAGWMLKFRWRSVKTTIPPCNT